MSKGNRPVVNTNPHAVDLKAQQAAYFDAGGTITVIPVGQGAGNANRHLTPEEARRAIAVDSGKYFRKYPDRGAA